MNVPKLRFKEFDGEWEEKDFEELLEAKDGIRRGPFGSALKKEFFVPESDYVIYEQQNAIYDKYTTRYNITRDKYEELIKFSLKPGDFIMSGAGTIGRISKVPKGIKKGVFNQALIRFRINSEITDSEYFLQFIRAEKMQRKLTGANPGSAITNLVPMSELKKWSIITPNIKEQQKISKFLKTVDKKIQLQQQKIDLLQEQKKGFLQKMFPKAGETQPEMRFDGFKGEWKERKLGEEMYIKSRIGWQRLTKDEQLSVGDYYLITGTDIDEKSHTVDLNRSVYVSKERYEKDQNIQVKNGDIIVTKDGTIGKIAMIRGLDKPATLNSHLFVLRDLGGNVNNRFLLHVLDSHIFKKFVESTKTGSTLTGLPQKTFIEFKYFLPEIDEQIKVANFLDTFDKKINMHYQKIELYKKQKSGFMQQMFI